MNAHSTPQRHHAGFTRTELLVVLAVAAATAFALAVLRSVAASSKHSDVPCIAQLKRLGLGFRVWADDHLGQFPMQVSTNEGGALEPAMIGDIRRVFQVLSNELSTPRILTCPQDSRASATSFSRLAPQNLSYLGTLDARASAPWDWLSGDANLAASGTPLPSGRLILTNREPLGWTSARHQGKGNLLLTDGSVRLLTTIPWATNSAATVRLVIP
jgi:prepilin-type processing-associated H-X9-DG protein